MIPDNPLTAKQKQDLKLLLHRWHKASSGRSEVFLFAGLLCVNMMTVILLVWLNISSKYIGIITSILSGSLGIIPIILYLLKRISFLQQLTEEEKHLLLQASVNGIYGDSRTAKSILTECGKLKANPRQEYLRASEKQDDDTLLRAANSTDNTPQEQLLRPSDTDNN